MQRFGQLQTSVDLQFAAWHLCQFGHPLEHMVADQCWPKVAVSGVSVVDTTYLR
jgi:hypothetical protein